MALHMSGDLGEFLDGEILQDQADGLSFRTSVGHFSVLSLYRTHPVEVSSVLSPEEVTQGQPQNAVGTVVAKPDPFSILINLPSDGKGLWR